MSDVYNQFLDEMEEKEDYEQSESAGIVREIKIETGWHGFEKGCGHDFWKYWRSFKNSEEMKPAYDSSLEALELDRLKKKPAKAIKVTIYPDDVTKSEMRDLYAVWMTDTYALISKSLRENKLPLGEKFWGRVSYVPDPNAVSKGEAGKTEEYEGKKIFPNIRIPVQKFDDKQEAMAFIEANQPSDSNVASNKYSAKAMKSFTVERLEMSTVDILATYDNALNGNQYMKKELPDAPVPFNLSEYEIILKKYTADIWEIDPSDVDILKNKEIPF